MALQYGTVTGRFLSPDGDPLSGTVQFAPDASAVLVTGADAATVAAASVTATLDADGYVSVDGVRGVSLLAPVDGVTNPSGWSYRVTPQLKSGTDYVPYRQFSVNVEAGTTVDLANAAPVPVSRGVAITRGVGVASASTVNGSLVLALDDGTTLDPVPLPAGTGGGGSYTITEVQSGLYEISGATLTEVQPGLYQIGA